MGTASTPLQQVQFSLDDFKSEEGINRLNQHLTNVVRTLNANIGTAGPVAMPSGIDAQGSKITNVGGVGPEHEAVSRSFAEANYSASAIKPKLEGGGSHALQTVRRVNDQQQKENYSTFLEGALNTAPTTNTATITGSGSTVTVSAGYHLLVSGNIQSFSARTDTVSLPSSVAIVSLSRSGSIVTAITSSASGYTPGSVVNITGASDSTFDGSYVLATAVGTTLTWRQVAANSTAIGGTVSEAGVYYYRLARNQTTLSLLGPYGADSQQNRLQANIDGGVLIAVAVFTGGGFDATQSAAGTTPPPATGGAHVLTRL
jgi:predicted phage tail protein